MSIRDFIPWILRGVSVLLVLLLVLRKAEVLQHRVLAELPALEPPGTVSGAGVADVTVLADALTEAFSSSRVVFLEPRRRKRWEAALLDAVDDSAEVLREWGSTTCGAPDASYPHKGLERLRLSSVIAASLPEHPESRGSSR